MTSNIIISEAQLKKIHENFKHGDKDADEKLSFKEFFCMSQKLQLGLSSAQVRDIFKNTDNDQNGSISFAEFLTTYFSLADRGSGARTSNLTGISGLNEGTLGKLRAYFYDKKSNKGKVTRMECLSMLRNFGIRLNNDEINRLFKLADDDSEHMISYEEFKILATRPGSKKPFRSDPVLRERYGSLYYSISRELEMLFPSKSLDMDDSGMKKLAIFKFFMYGRYAGFYILDHCQFSTSYEQQLFSLRIHIAL